MKSHPMVSPAFNVNNESSSNEDAKGKKVLALNRSCIPLTIGLIKKHVQPVDERFMLRGTELTDASAIQTVCIIGAIRDILVQESSVSYTIEDGTGAIDIRQWKDAPFTETNEERVCANTAEVYPRDIYIKVYGRIQSYSDRIFFVSFKTTPIKDFNEITFHYLDSIHAYLQLTAIKKNKPSLSSSSIQLANPPLHKISKNNINGIVKRAIKVCGDEEVGSHISSIIDHLKNLFDETQVMRCLNELAEEGQIYSLMEDYVQLVDL
ncbi:hypothetical protein MBANPS3_011672 [Mucor bainieri]